MNQIIKYKYYDTPEGEDIFLKTFAASKYAAFAGSLLSFYDILMYSKPKTIAATAGRYLWFVGPMVGMAAGFTVTANAAKNIRGVDDKLNSFFGGAVAGSIFSAWQKKPIIAVPAMVVLGIAGVVKKTAIQENWVFFPEIIQSTKTIKSVRHDWTLAKDIEELKGFTTKAN